MCVWVGSFFWQCSHNLRRVSRRAELSRSQSPLLHSVCATDISWGRATNSTCILSLLVSLPLWLPPTLTHCSPLLKDKLFLTDFKKMLVINPRKSETQLGRLIIRAMWTVLKQQDAKWRSACGFWTPIATVTLDTNVLARVNTMTGTWCCQWRWNPSAKALCVDFLAGSGQNRHSIHRVRTTWRCQPGSGSEWGVKQPESAASETSSPSPKTNKSEKDDRVCCHLNWLLTANVC